MTEGDREDVRRRAIIAPPGAPMREAAAGLWGALAAWKAALVPFANAMRAVMERLTPRRRLVVEDPFTWRPTSLRGWGRQAGAIMLHEFWMAAERPERSPGARWVRP